MKARDFIYWLQGAFEIGKITSIDAETMKVIQNHIAMVFIEEIDPSFDKDKQQALQDAHDAASTIGTNRRPPGGVRMKC